MQYNPDASAASITIYHYDLSGKLIAETSEAGEAQRDYIWANQTPAAQIDHSSTANQDSVNYLHTDHLLTPRFATNGGQQVIWRWEGEAFGEAEANEDPDGDASLTRVNLRFPGQYFDGESGLHYNYFRDYDPSLGRYIQSDPRGILLDFSDPQRQVATDLGVPIPDDDPFGLNHNYGYANQSPLINIDPTGESLGTAIGVGVTLLITYAYIDCVEKCVEQEQDKEGCDTPGQNVGNCAKRCSPFLKFFGWNSPKGLAGKGVSGGAGVIGGG